MLRCFTIGKNKRRKAGGIFDRINGIGEEDRLILDRRNMRRLEEGTRLPTPI
jgi:hypothetical protein